MINTKLTEELTFYRGNPAEAARALPESLRFFRRGMLDPRQVPDPRRMPDRRRMPDLRADFRRHKRSAVQRQRAHRRPACDRAASVDEPLERSAPR